MRSALLGLLLILPILSGVAVAHEPDTFTVIVREDRHDPSEVNLVVNDTVQYYNVDSRENITHVIGLDLNGDDDFDDEGEFSSGVLHSECDWDNDTDCRVAWIFVINDTALVGNYILSDIRSDGTQIEVQLNVAADIHPISQPGIGECFGDCDEEGADIEEQVSTQSDLQKVMIVLGTIMLCSSIIFSMNLINRQS